MRGGDSGVPRDRSPPSASTARQTTLTRSARSAHGLHDVVDTVDRFGRDEILDLRYQLRWDRAGIPPLVVRLAGPGSDDHDVVLVIDRGRHLDPEKAGLLTS